MGYYGWRERADYVTLTGTAENHKFNGGTTGDRDWSLFVRPDGSSQGLLYNSGNVRNSDGVIECEVYPSGEVNGDSGPSNESNVFSRLMGKRVRVVGTWCDDKSHSDKTEIHPITSVVCEHPQNAQVTDVDFMVFSEMSSTFGVTFWPPRPDALHAGENRTGTCSVPFPIPDEDDLVPVATNLYTVDKSNGASISIAPYGASYVLQGSVQSGTNKRGLFYTNRRLQYDSGGRRLWIASIVSQGWATWGYQMDWSRDSFIKNIEGWRQSGWLLRSVRTYVQNGVRLWSGVIVRPPVKRQFYFNLKMTLQDLFGQFGSRYGKWQLTDIVPYREDNAIWWAAVWQEYAIGSQGLVAEKDWGSFASITQDWFNRGSPLSVVRPYVDQWGNRRWAGIADPMKVGSSLEVFDSFDAFISRWGAHYGKMTLKDIQTYVDGGQRRWVGLWQTPFESNGLIYYVDRARFVDEMNKATNSGYRIQSYATFHG